MMLILRVRNQLNNIHTESQYLKEEIQYLVDSDFI